jgi:ABC-type sugar transport system substrate-binding protein
MHIFDTARTSLFRISGIVGVACAVALAATACSSSTHAGSGSTSASGNSACVAKARAAVATAEKPITANLPATFDMAKNRGKSVWDISQSLVVPLNVQQAQGFTAAAEAVGLVPHVWNSKGSVTTAAEGIDDAINTHAAGIVLQGVEPTDVRAAVAAAKAAHIPVVLGGFVVGNDPLVPGVTGRTVAEYGSGGAIMADVMAMMSKCSLQTVIFGDTEFKVLTAEANGLTAELARLCRATCKVDNTYNTPATSWATGMSQLASSAAQRYPKAQYFAAMADAMTTSLISGISSVSGNEVILGHDAVTSNLSAMKQGGGKQIADVGSVPAEVNGWYEVDLIGRAMLGLPVGNEVMGKQVLFTPQNLARNTLSLSALYPKLANYQGLFLKNWGLSTGG